VIVTTRSQPAASFPYAAGLAPILSANAARRASSRQETATCSIPGSAARRQEICVPGLEPKHLSNPDEKVTYNSFPPSSGPHYQQPAPWGIYEDPIKQTILVHNLEHGGIVLQYGDVSEETLRDIQAFYQDDPYGVVVSPYKRLGKKIALTAWNEPRYERAGEFEDVDPGNGYVLTCTQWDRDAADEFRDERRNKAGERYASVQDMAPGA